MTIEIPAPEPGEGRWLYGLRMLRATIPPENVPSHPVALSRLVRCARREAIPFDDIPRGAEMTALLRLGEVYEVRSGDTVWGLRIPSKNLWSRAHVVRVLDSSVDAYFAGMEIRIRSLRKSPLWMLPLHPAMLGSTDVPWLSPLDRTEA